jgi:hypothetical protein
MSLISDIYDEVKSRVTAQLPSHKLLPNPYRVESNPETFLRQGVGIKINEAVNTEEIVNCSISIDRSIQIAVTRQYYTTELDRNNLEDVEKILLEDFALITHDVEKNPNLNITALNEYPHIKYVSDNGIELVFDDKDNFIKIVGNFTVKYFENL